MITHSISVVVTNPSLGGSPATGGTTPGQPPAPEQASVVTKAGRLRRELTTWMKSGAKLVTHEERRARLAICAACSYYNAAGNLGLGECRYPGCGCTRAKAALATSRCPAVPSKWPSLVASKSG